MSDFVKLNSDGNLHHGAEFVYRTNETEKLGNGFMNMNLGAAKSINRVGGLPMVEKLYGVKIPIPQPPANFNYSKNNYPTLNKIGKSKKPVNNLRFEL